MTQIVFEVRLNLNELRFDELLAFVSDFCTFMAQVFTDV
jgi:hypothetical protein